MAKVKNRKIIIIALAAAVLAGAVIIGYLAYLRTFLPVAHPCPTPPGDGIWSMPACSPPEVVSVDLYPEIASMVIGIFAVAALAVFLVSRHIKK